MNERILANEPFLRQLIRNFKIISTATTQELECLIELCYNIHKLALSRTERNSIVKYLPIIRYIGKIREATKAREFLSTFGSHFIRTIVRAALLQKR